MFDAQVSRKSRKIYYMDFSFRFLLMNANVFTMYIICIVWCYVWSVVCVCLCWWCCWVWVLLLIQWYVVQHAAASLLLLSNTQVFASTSTSATINIRMCMDYTAVTESEVIAWRIHLRIYSSNILLRWEYANYGVIIILSDYIVVFCFHKSSFGSFRQPHFVVALDHSCSREVILEIKCHILF